jgi:phenylacetic acid degradation protein paaN
MEPLTMINSMELYQKHKDSLDLALKALDNRTYFTIYPESPKAYGEEADKAGKDAFVKRMNHDFDELLQQGADKYIGEEVSPYLQTGLGTRYPFFTPEELIKRSKKAAAKWNNTKISERAGVLIEALDRIKSRFFEIAYATMHTTGQSFMMSFQASGPHANDRALEVIAMGYRELTRFPENAEWVKPMGKFDLKLNKNWKPMAKGTGLVIGCSTFPTWNTVPGLFADLITGNTVIVKPHPKAVLPIAIVIGEIQKTLQENGFDPETVQLAVDTTENPVTRELAEHPDVKLIDFTGSTKFGTYIESLPKTVFTEKAGVNSIILDSVKELAPVLQNIAFSASLYSGQMCTAPQNIFIPESGIQAGEQNIPFEEVVKALSDSIQNLVNNPKIGAGTLGGIQSDATLQRVKNAKNLGGKVILESGSVKNEEFEHARIATPTLIEVNADDKIVYENECFGPVVFLIKTRDTRQSVAIAREMATVHGAITCGAYTTDEKTAALIEEEMNSSFTPVSFNFTGAAFINSHAAFSDLHVTGGNPSGNASFTDSNYISRRFVWVGNRYN